mmetsp:Transcript_2048/g.5049  ORF Transcript_2048/g.5049 Transcript_2048/m.5049 type:complete len:243 (-) Transcript_2048:282-1010(-)
MLMRASATTCRSVSCFASTFPNAFRRWARYRIAASAASAWPMVRMQWWMRPGPRRPWAISNPRPSPRIMLVAGTRTLSKTISAWSCSWPKTAMGRMIWTPGASRGTRIMLCCRWSAPSKLVRPRKMKTLHSGRQAPLIHHLCPLITYSSPSRSIREEMLVASLEATPGSVMAKALRICPASRGLSHCSFCSGVPYFSRTSMFPVSGAVQFIARFARGNAPSSSPMGAYSSTESPLTSGRKKL